MFCTSEVPQVHHTLTSPVQLEHHPLIQQILPTQANVQWEQSLPCRFLVELKYFQEKTLSTYEYIVQLTSNMNQHLVSIEIDITAIKCIVTSIDTESVDGYQSSPGDNQQPG